MCGIAGFILRDLPDGGQLPDWLSGLADNLERLPSGLDAAGPLKGATETLLDGFNDLMSARTCFAISSDDAARKAAEKLARALTRHEAALLDLSEQGHTDVDPVIEGLRDMTWQIREELLGGVERIRSLLDGRASPRAFGAAFGVEHVLTAIDRLEVRGRDSAGIHIQAEINPGAASDLRNDLAAHPDFKSRSGAIDTGDGSISVNDLSDGRLVIGFTYKTANLIGRLGDNGAALRASVRGDDLFWMAMEQALRVDILSHTRWASSGLISVPNCHPHNAAITGDNPSAPQAQWIAALNGDVDNHMELARVMLQAQQRHIDPAITTDAKIIPLACRFAEVGGNRSVYDTFRSAVRHLDGSMAIASVNAAYPGEVLIAQKGSGQGMHLARVADGWMFGSEVYGLASLTRNSFDLARQSYGGVAAQVRSNDHSFELKSIGDESTITVPEADIQIFARDIYRGDFETFLEKEINDAPFSVAKTLRGRYRIDEDRVRFDGLPTDIWANLRDFVAGGIESVYVIGQGTAGVAAEGIAHLMERSLAQGIRRAVPIKALRSSEMSAKIDTLDLRRALVIAVSQSGTTTDTNRAVDLAIDRGAFVHCIVNRRGSDLVRKSQSVFYTSDGRDIEMSVASTKAFYAQLVAGKLTSLFIASAAGTLSPLEVLREVRDLESLPEKLSGVLTRSDVIEEAAKSFAPKSRYWAVVGSGVNHIPAMEIRIKLSELCYKSIPVDFTEDKKHIDLSTEPLTLVMATDLQHEVLGDLVKEAAIFRAHNGKPLVFTTEGSDAEAFATHAERVIALPKVGSGLGFILAAVAGHIFGLHAARAIDEGAQRLRLVMNAVGRVAEAGDLSALDEAIERLGDVMDRAIAGEFDSGLSSRDIASVAMCLTKLQAIRVKGIEGADFVSILSALRTAFDETSRPIDTIRHQAKTVTVGTSRPEDVLAPVMREAMALCNVTEARLGAADRRSLAAISRLVEEVPAVSAFRVEGGGKAPRVRFAAGQDEAAQKRYAGLAAPIGTLGLALDKSRLAVGNVRAGIVLAVPLFDEDNLSVTGLLQFTLSLQVAAPREHKVAVLKAREQYGNLLRAWENACGEGAEDLLLLEIAQADPETVLCRARDIADRAQLAGDCGKTA